MEYFIKAAQLAVGAVVLESAGVEANRPGVFVEFLLDRKRFKEVGSE